MSPRIITGTPSTVPPKEEEHPGIGGIVQKEHHRHSECEKKIKELEGLLEEAHAEMFGESHAEDRLSCSSDPNKGFCEDGSPGCWHCRVRAYLTRRL